MGHVSVGRRLCQSGDDRLGLASFVTWTVALAKGIELMVAARKLTEQIGVVERA